LCDVKKRYDAKGVHVYLQYESQFWNQEVQNTIDTVEREEGVKLNLVKVETPKNMSKYDRILTLQPYYQNNRIRYNEKMKADNDTSVGNDQLKGIEPGYKTKDDSPDSDERAIAKLTSMYKVLKEKAVWATRKPKFRY
jgi:hypothetical protein